MRSILIVEDDITFGMMLKTWLGKKGFNVSSVSNIARAQKHIDAQPVDLILSDLRLPDHDGIHLLKWMGEKELHIPLIIMTGYADIQSAVQAMKLGAQDYIAKPVNPEELLKKMSEALQKKEAPLPKTPLTEKSPKTKQESCISIFRPISCPLPGRLRLSGSDDIHLFRVPIFVGQFQYRFGGALSDFFNDPDIKAIVQTVIQFMF